MCGGERNRALTIVKCRGTRHSNQVRELILSDQGIALADVYSSGGEVLMGTLRAYGFPNVVGMVRPRQFDLWVVGSSALDETALRALAAAHFPGQAA